MGKREIGPDGLYHILSRGVDRRKIFLDDSDRLRFLHNLFEFNDVNPPGNSGQFFKTMVIARPKFEIGTKGRRKKEPRELLVRIHAFCLMPNHYHLLLSPLRENGISLFMKKLNMGYAKYFNEKNKRTGALFEGRFKSVAVTSSAHFIHLPTYIHMNPLDIVAPEWRNRNMRDYRKAIEFLGQYRWSSYLDYIGKKNFPSITQREFLSDLLGSPAEYKADAMKWLRDLDLERINDLCLE
jgi:putative transposase